MAKKYFLITKVDLVGKASNKAHCCNGLYKDDAICMV